MLRGAAAKSRAGSPGVLRWGSRSGSPTLRSTGSRPRRLAILISDPETLPQAILREFEAGVPGSLATGHRWPDAYGKPAVSGTDNLLTAARDKEVRRSAFQSWTSRNTCSVFNVDSFGQPFLVQRANFAAAGVWTLTLNVAHPLKAAVVHLHGRGGQPLWTSPADPPNQRRHLTPNPHTPLGPSATTAPTEGGPIDTVSTFRRGAGFACTAQTQGPSWTDLGDNADANCALRRAATQSALRSRRRSASTT